MLPAALEQFIKVFSRLPGVGQKTAERLGFYIVSKNDDFARALSDAVTGLKANVSKCSRCGGLSESGLCGICSDSRRDSGSLCIVENALDIFTMESTHSFSGHYHVLEGVLSPLNGVTPADLRIRELLERVQREPVSEILFATSPTTEGDTTALYIKSLLEGRNIRFTHLARGIPVGTDLQYAGTGSLSEAIRKREVW